MPQPHHSGSSSELELLRALIESFDGLAPSRADVEQGLETGLARLMVLEGRLRKRTTGPSETRPSEEPRKDYELDEEIRELHEAVAELRARAYQGGPAPLAKGFVLRREP